MRKQDLHPHTAHINKKQKLQSKKARDEALSWLAKTFPTAFDNTQSIHPLKHGIMEDILKFAPEAAKAGISKSKLREAVVVYTRRIDYLTTLKAREMRIDLAGAPVEMVTLEDAERAAGKIKKRVDKYAKNAVKTNSYKAFSASKSSTGFLSQDIYLDSRVTSPSAASTTSIKVKNKARSLDPDAVARLKEKLGLSRTS